MSSICYPGQLLYSTTITTLKHWKKTEPHTSSPDERLETCLRFQKHGVQTNVLLKPFFASITGAELEDISEALLRYKINYCTIGVLYWNTQIERKILNNPFLKELISFDNIKLNHLDCDGDALLNATDTGELRAAVEYMRRRGIKAFLKSSCINANLLSVVNRSNYYNEQHPYCLKCGNCEKNNEI